MRHLPQLADANQRLKHLGAEVTLDNAALKDVRANTWSRMPPGARVTRVCDRLRQRCGLPEVIIVDHGPEFTGKHWTPGRSSTACRHTLLTQARRSRMRMWSVLMPSCATHV